MPKVCERQIYELSWKQELGIDIIACAKKETKMKEFMINEHKYGIKKCIDDIHVYSEKTDVSGRIYWDRIEVVSKPCLVDVINAMLSHINTMENQMREMAMKL